MRHALIGHTGFVGSNLLSQGRYEALYNSKNIETLSGHFDRVVCAGAPAAKWIANRDPAGDLASIQRLVSALDRITCAEFVLISTIDVYPQLQGADEDTALAGQANHAYGKHRLWLEEQVRGRFPTALIVRLPALFGPGLKKNVIYDLLHDNCIEAIQPKSTFQWYGLQRLSDDLALAHRHGLRLVNLFTEPLPTQQILTRLFPEKRVGERAGPEAHYALKSRHAELFGGRDGYVQSAEHVLSSLAEYVESERGSAEL